MPALQTALVQQNHPPENGETQSSPILAEPILLYSHTSELQIGGGESVGQLQRSHKLSQSSGQSLSVIIEIQSQLLLHCFPESQLLPGDLPSQAESAPQEDLQTFEQEPPEHLKGLHEEVFIHRQN